MILLAYLSCFLDFFLLFAKDQIASLQLKQIVVFFKLSVPYICVFISLCYFNLIIELLPVQSTACMHAVDSLNGKHELRSKRVKQLCRHVDISKRYFLVCQLEIVFYVLHEVKQRSCDVIVQH